MDEQLNYLNEDIKQLRRMINGYLSTNPQLSNLEVDGLSFRYKDDKTAAANEELGLEAADEFHTRFCCKPGASPRPISGALSCRDDETPC